MIVARVGVNLRSEEYRRLRDVLAERGVSWLKAQDEIAEAANAAATVAARAKAREIIERDEAMDATPLAYDVVE
mgnify:CR=1 FL=1